jgi:hypothetical protein
MSSRPSAADVLRAALAKPTPEPTWVDAAIEHERRHQEYVAQREAKRKAEEAEAAKAQQTTAELLANAIRQASAGSSPSMPLNGAAVLRAALGGQRGTVNGGE